MISIKTIVMLAACMAASLGLGLGLGPKGELGAMIGARQPAAASALGLDAAGGAGAWLEAATGLVGLAMSGVESPVEVTATVDLAGCDQKCGGAGDALAAAAGIQATLESAGCEKKCAGPDVSAEAAVELSVLAETGSCSSECGGVNGLAAEAGLQAAVEGVLGR
jgi:hypothetical protein